MSRNDKEWELIFRFNDLSNAEVQKRIDFLKSLPRSGLPLDRDEKEQLELLQSLQNTRSKKPMVSATKKEAQIVKYKFPKVEQSKIDGSPTEKNDSVMKFFVEADDLSGSGRSINYWAEEIVRALRYNKGGSAEAAYDNVIADAEAQGLTKDQKKALDTLLVRWHVPVPVKDFDKETDPFDSVKSDYTIGLKQKQVAAALRAKREATEYCDEFLRDISKYKANRKAIVHGYRKAQLDGKITTLLRNKFSREEVAAELPGWNFPEDLKRQAMVALLPKKVALSSPRIALSNDLAVRRATVISRAIKAIASRSLEDSLTPQQKLRLAALKATKRLVTPWWIGAQGMMHLDDLSPSFRHQIDKEIGAMIQQRGMIPPQDLRILSKKYGVPTNELQALVNAVKTRKPMNPAMVLARLEDGRVLEATIEENGDFTQKLYLDKNLKLAIKKAFSPEEGWVKYLTERFAQKESLEDEASEEEGTTNEEEDTSPKFAHMDDTSSDIKDRLKQELAKSLGKEKLVHIDPEFQDAEDGTGQFREEQLQDPLEPQRVDIEQLQGR
jgi:hypothetical protein